MPVFLIIATLLVSSNSYGSSYGKFSDQRYRGWFWFENKSIKSPRNIDNTEGQGNFANKSGDKSNYNVNDRSNNSNNSLELSAPYVSTPEIARNKIEKFAKELEDLRFVMMAFPSIENVKAYRDKEKQMWLQAEKLNEAWNMANLMYPDQRDLVNNPVNVHAVKVKRELDLEENDKKIKELALKVDLVLFFSSSCRYCKLLSPVLKNFGEKYGFSIEAVSSDVGKHEYFKTYAANELIDNLGIKAFPTVIAVTHDSKHAFELIRGYVSISELEEYSLLAIKYLQAQGIWDKLKVKKS